MTNIEPAGVVEEAVATGRTKASTSSAQLVHRGVLGGALLGCTTSFAVYAAESTGSPLVGALVFPAGITIVILLGMELVTGGFAMVPMAAMEKLSPWSAVLRYSVMVIIGHILGALAFAFLFTVALNGFWSTDPGPVGDQFIATAESKTLDYQAAGIAGLGTVFVWAVLCNWLVCLGVFMAFTSKDTVGKIAAIWLPIMVFYGLGFEHAVVNFFMIPMGMFLGADVSIADWWLWNQIPVLLGNFVGGFVFTGLALLVAFRPHKD